MVNSKVQAPLGLLSFFPMALTSLQASLTFNNLFLLLVPFISRSANNFLVFPTQTSSGLLDALVKVNNLSLNSL